MTTAFYNNNFIITHISMINPAIENETFSLQFTGDEVLSVNGTAFQNFTHQEALDTFKVIILMIQKYFYYLV